MINDFLTIRDYLTQTNIRLASSMDDFLVYDYEQLNSDAQLVQKAYRHHFYEITLDVNMGCRFQVDKFNFENEKRLLAVISPRRLQSVEKTERNQSSRGFSLFFHPDFLSDQTNTRLLHNDYAFLKTTNSPAIRLSEKASNELVTLFQLVHYEYNEYGFGAKDTLKNLIGAIMNKAKQNYTNSEQPWLTNGRDYELAKQFEVLVQERFLQSTTIKEYANALHTSDKHLSQAVKNVTGRNALEILTSIRINYAKALLRQTSLSPVEVSYELNFSNSNYFFTYFKKRTGQTPLEYKRGNLK